MNSGLEFCPLTVAPRIEITGGWRCESILFAAHVQLEEDRMVPRDISNVPIPYPPHPSHSVPVECWYPADADAVVEQQMQQGNEEDPFWCYLWPTARTLAQQVFRALQTPAPQKLGLTSAALNDDRPRLARCPSIRVLEAGCGIGLVGLAALAAGTTTVTFQDLRSRSVKLALHNARVNGFGDRVLAETFDWRYVRNTGKPLLERALGYTPQDQTFDWIIASDVLYHAPDHEPLLNFLEGAIRDPDRNTNAPVKPSFPAISVVDLSQVPIAHLELKGSIWIGDPGRREAEDFIQSAQSRFQIYIFDDAGRLLSSPNRGHYQLIVLYPHSFFAL